MGNRGWAEALAGQCVARDHSCGLTEALLASLMLVSTETKTVFACGTELKLHQREISPRVASAPLARVFSGKECWNSRWSDSADRSVQPVETTDGCSREPSIARLSLLIISWPTAAYERLSQISRVAGYAVNPKDGTELGDADRRRWTRAVSEGLFPDSVLSRA